MSQAALLTKPVRSPRPPRGLLALGAGAAALAGLIAVAPRLHAPDLRLLAEVSWLIQLHLGAALTALLIGTALLAGVKGSARHKVLGWTWIVAMVLTAGSSLFITETTPGRWSFIHFFSGWVLIALPMGVAAVRRRNLRMHRRMMTGTFVGGLVVAGAFTFVPGRLMWAVFFG